MTQIIDDVKLDFCDVMIRPGMSGLNSRKEVAISRNFKFQNGRLLMCTPLVASNMTTVGTRGMADRLSQYNMLTCLHKHYTLQEIEEWYSNSNARWDRDFFFTIGVSGEDFDKLNKFSICPHVLDQQITHPLICIDVANGYMTRMLDRIKEVRELYPNCVLCAGNVVTPQAAGKYIMAGADIIKIGIGSGSCCLTRKKTGVGYPQLSAIMECAEIVHERGGYIMSDGGCASSGDIAKAFCAGADFVMLGGMLAGHDECELEFIDDDCGNKFAYCYGMSSEHAMIKHNGGMESHRTSEGKLVKIRPRGPVTATIQDILGGLRSTGTYIGAATIEEFSKKTTFIKVQHQLNHYFGKD